MEKYFLVKPINGLANRMRAIASSMAFASLTKRQLLVCWSSSPGFDNTPWQELFQNQLTIIDEHHFNGIRELPNTIKFATDGSPRFDGNKLRWLKGQDAAEFWCYEGHDSLGNLLSLSLSNIWTHPDRFQRDYIHRLQSLRFSAEVESVVDAFKREHFKNCTFGMHIRRGDAILTPFAHRYLASSDDAFRRAVHKLKRDCRARVYLATDSIHSLDTFKREFGNTILSYNKDFVDSTPGANKGGQKDAAIEFKLLASTRRLYGTSYSSFSLEAARYGGIPMQVVK